MTRIHWMAAIAGCGPAQKLASVPWSAAVEGVIVTVVSVSVTSGIDWFDLGASLDFGGGVSATLPELLAALRRGDRTVKLSDDSLGMLSGEWLEKSGFLAAAGTMVGGNLRFSAKQLGVLDVLLSALPPADTDSAFEHARQQLLRFEGVHPAEAPDGFVLTLTDEDGVSVAVDLAHGKEIANNAERAIATLREQLGKFGNTMVAAEPAGLLSTRLMCAYRSMSLPTAENSTAALPLRNASTCSIVRSFVSFMLITILQMINPLLLHFILPHSGSCFAGNTTPRSG